MKHRSRAALRVGEPRAVRRRVIRIRVRKVAAGEETVARGRADQPPHAAMGKRVLTSAHMSTSSG